MEPGARMTESVYDPEGLFRATAVGDTIRMRIPKDQLEAEVRDRVSPILEPNAVPGDPPIFRGFRKDPAGMWDLESATSARNGSIVEVIVRRVASDL
jgi:hypothetical protein